MKKRFLDVVVISFQLCMAIFFLLVGFGETIQTEKYVGIVHNDNLNKIAKSVSTLFEDEIILDEVFDYTLNDLPSIDVVNVSSDDEVGNLEDKNENKVVTVPLVSVDASKYSDAIDMGFKVTENNKQYNLTDAEFDVVVAVVAYEYDRTLNDALAVMSVILNRCDSQSWVSWFGASPYSQVIGRNQFEVYTTGWYKYYMPTGKGYGSEKYEVAKQAVIDGLNGIRNNNYYGFRSWQTTSYSNKYIVYGGNRYGYN